MSDFDKTLKNTDLSHSESYSQDEIYEITKYRKIEMIFNILKDLNIKKLENVNEIGQENIKKAICGVLANNIAGKGSGLNKIKFLIYCRKYYQQSKIVKHQFFLYLISDLLEATEIAILTYSEKKSLKKYIASELEIRCGNIKSFIDEITSKYPNIHEKSTLNKNKFIDIETRRQAVVIKLIELKQKQRELLFKLVNNRLSPAIENEMKLKLLESKKTQLKANTVKAILEMEILTPTQYAEKALHEVDNEIKRLIAEKKGL